LLLGFASACSSGGGGSTQQTAPQPEVSKAGQTVTAKDVSNTPSGSVEKTLEGRFPGVVVLKTSNCTLTLSDLPGAGITIETKSGMKITMVGNELKITDGAGSISLQGPKVSVNNGALEVT